jgi:hypothetical protein
VRRALICLALVCVGRASAEPVPALPPLSPLQARPEASLSPLKLELSDLDRVERTARVRRNAGIGLTVPGVTLLIVGAVLIGIGVRDIESQDSRFVTAATEIATGSISAAAGLVFTVPGALLWLGGQDDLDLVKWRRARMSGTPSATP